MKNYLKSNKGGFLKFLGIFFLVILILIGIIIGSTYAFITSKLNNINHIEISKDSITVNSGIDENLKNYRNIALFGIDSRDNSFENSRSDCIIIISINEKEKDIKLTSIYRDTYVNIEGYGLDKITHAYAYGGPELAINTINTNLDLNITEFVTVNFETVKTVVDTIGGITLKLTDEEANQIGFSTGGTYDLDGSDALAYSRIRIIDSDYQRTERIRTVIDAVFEKIKTKDISEVLDYIDIILPHISTNISNNKIISMSPMIFSYNISDSIGWPYNVKGYSSDAWYAVPVTLENNVKNLHEELFNDINYTPSSQVQNISNNIIDITGYEN